MRLWPVVHLESPQAKEMFQMLTLPQIVAHTERNSFEVFIGRSMSRPHHPAVKINFYKRHIKLIGASQHGKSSMAAALLDAITRTHDPELVQIALLDLEDRTSRLFAGLPHITRIRKHGETIRLHARSYEQVLEHLEHVSALIDYRYALPDEELEKQPLVVVYVEEFLDLKNYFKRRIETVGRDERDSARADYSRLIYIIGKIAARGLKVSVQLLMCSQVDYRDEDLVEALANVTAGMSFCVRTSAAQAAGFYQTELLQRNAKEDKIGQAVAEMPDCKDLILAPEYDLKVRLSDLAKARREPLAFPAMRPQVYDELAVATGTHTTVMPPSSPAPPMTRRHVTVQDAYNAWQEGATGIRKVERALNIPYNKAREFVMELARQGLITLEE